MSETPQKWLWVLGLKGDPPRADIDRAYVELLQVWDPGQFEQNRGLQLRAKERLAQISEAYANLTSPPSTPKGLGTAPADNSVAPDVALGGGPDAGEVSRIISCPVCGGKGRVGKWFDEGGPIQLRCPRCQNSFTLSPAADEASHAAQPSAHASPMVGRRANGTRRFVIAAVLLLAGGWSLWKFDLLVDRSPASDPVTPDQVLSYERLIPMPSEPAKREPAILDFGKLEPANEPPGCQGATIVPRPQTSQELGGRWRGGRAELRVSNGTENDGIAVLYDPYDEPKRALYVRRHETGVMTAVPAGTYRLKFQFGDDWLETREFCPPMGSAEFDEALEFSETRDEDGVRYRGFTVTLHSVPSGTARTSPLPNVPLPLPPG